MNFEINLCNYLSFEEKENICPVMIKTERADVEWLFREKCFHFDS